MFCHNLNLTLVSFCPDTYIYLLCSSLLIHTLLLILFHVCTYILVLRTAHGPDSGTFLKASSPESSLTPVYLNSGLAFMFESMFMLKIAPSALSSPLLQPDYRDCWASLPKMFNGTLDPTKS